MKEECPTNLNLDTNQLESSHRKPIP